MKNINWKTVIVSAIIALVTVWIFKPSNQSTQKESVYDRVMRTKTLRCGYAIWNPLLIKDPNTGKLSGVFYDYMNEISKRTGIKIEWKEEVGFGEIISSLKTDRIDAFCSGVWATCDMSANLGYTNPIYFNSVQAYVRKNDFRFDNAPEKINKKSIIVAGIDGEIAGTIPLTQFPKATVFSLPQLSSPDMILTNVMTKKADITFTDEITGNNFMKANPGKLRQVKLKYPIRFYGNSIGFGIKETELISMFNVVTNELLYSGVIEQILKKYEDKPNTIKRVYFPYKGGKQ